MYVRNRVDRDNEKSETYIQVNIRFLLFKC